MKKRSTTITNNDGTQDDALICDSYKTKPHKTEKIAIKTANVDKVIIPLINWLNSYESITTAYCCQGDPCNKNADTEQQRLSKPYILFTCINSIDLIAVISLMGSYGTVEIHWNDMKNQIEYVIRFTDYEAMLETIKAVRLRRKNLKSQMIHR